MAAYKKIEERLGKIEQSVERIVEQLKLMETLENRISECEKKREGIHNVDTVSDSVGTVSDSLDTILL